jgi:hypothetical protein
MEVSSLISLFPAPVLPLPTLSEEVGQLDLVVSPLALAGFLGLHFTEMTILPVGVLETDQIVTGVLGIGVQHTYQQALASWLWQSCFLPQARTHMNGLLHTSTY